MDIIDDYNKIYLSINKDIKKILTFIVCFCIIMMVEYNCLSGTAQHVIDYDDLSATNPR